MHRPYQRITAVLLTLILALGLSLPAFALEDVETRTVRVGFYHAEGYHVMHEDGSRSGYGYDLLQAMKLYVNWTYEYIGYDKGWADMQQMLLDGEIDLVVSAVKTPERMEIYDFSELPISQSGACLMVRAGESAYVAGDYECYDGMRIGFIENASQIAKTEEFATEKGFSFTPVYYKTSGELEQAILVDKAVDAIATSNMRIINGTRRLEMFAMQDVHVMVQKGDSELLAEIDYALEQISLYNPTLYSTLFDKYYSVDTGDEVFFSPEESEFIDTFRQSGAVLRVALVPDMSPYACYPDGAPAGILYDIASEILRRTGLEFEVAATYTNAEYRALIENPDPGTQDVDLRLAARFDYNYAEEFGYTLTSPYYETDVSRVVRKDSGDAIRTIAAVSNSTIETFYLPTIIRDETIVYFDTVSQCVQALLDGRCDALYLFTRAAQEAVYTDQTNRLTSVIMPDSRVSFCLGVREGVDARLASILEKTVASLSEQDISALVLRYTDYDTRSISFLGMLYSEPVFMLALLALVLVLVFALVMIVFVTRRRRQEREQNVKLQAALSSAEQANSAKSVFMSRMSHEIRTPLNAIVGYNSICVNTLARARSEPEYRLAAMKAMDCLTKSDMASKHLLTIINDVLDMAAIESGKIKIAQEAFDFKNMVSALTVMFFSQAKAKELDFEVLFATPTEEWFIGDQMRISQILTNLLSNAIKFTPGGGSVRLTIGQASLDEQAARIIFEIKDTGIGMESEFLTSIWKPFEQADASISRRFGGTGLGLSITKNLVDLMNGSIEVESELGKGAAFRVDIPLARMQQPEPNLAYDFTGINVLVADDDQSTCDYLKLLFHRSSVRCTAVTSGAEAAAAVAAGIESNDPFTVCLIDWHMPNPDGLETVRHIRKLAGDDVPIIIITAYDFSEIEAEAKAVGVDSFVAKPLFPSAVFDLLANIGGSPEAAAQHKPHLHDFGGARVLLAEDNRMNMEIAKAILSSGNLVVDEAWNGQEAVNKFCTAPAGTYQAILMDVHMPEMDGYHATQAIRASAHAEAAVVPIIAMTADVFAEDVAEAMAAGMNDHIGKPIDKALLFEALKKYL